MACFSIVEIKKRGPEAALFPFGTRRRTFSAFSLTTILMTDLFFSIKECSYVWFEENHDTYSHHSLKISSQSMDIFEKREFHDTVMSLYDRCTQTFVKLSVAQQRLHSSIVFHLYNHLHTQNLIQSLEVNYCLYHHWNFYESFWSSTLCAAKNPLTYFNSVSCLWCLLYNILPFFLPLMKQLSSTRSIYLTAIMFYSFPRETQVKYHYNL